MGCAKMRHRSMLSLLLVALCAAPSCTKAPAPARREPAAPSFNAISDEQLDSAMWRLASGVTRIQAILVAEGSITEERRLEVIDILDEMIAAANALGPEPASPGHAQVAHNFDRFREKLEIARDSAAMQPPRYFLVGNLSGTCLACHTHD